MTPLKLILKTLAHLATEMKHMQVNLDILLEADTKMIDKNIVSWTDLIKELEEAEKRL